jgi:acetyl esterase/lipase
MRAVHDPSQRYELDFTEVSYLQDADKTFMVRVCQPRGEGPFPAMLFVHGGHWSLGDRMRNTWLYEEIAARGLAVFSIDFRRSPQHPYPLPLADINYGVRWVKAHAGDFNASTDGVGALGASSGGHQIMLNALRPADARYTTRPMPEAPGVDASLAYVIGCWPILDPYARYLFAQDTGREELVEATEGYFGSVEAMQEGNPTLIVERGQATHLPPTLIIQGTEDTNVTPEMQRRFAAACWANGMPCELEVFDGMPHGTTQWPADKVHEAVELITRFIARRLNAPG